MWKIGIAKKEITAYEIGGGLFGYGMWYQKAERADTPLFCRAFVFEEPNSRKTFALICCDLGMISVYLKHEVVRAMQAQFPETEWSDANILITAQHTHAGPAGITQYAFYNTMVPGFRPAIFQKIKKGIVACIAEAFEKRENAQLDFAEKAFSRETFIGINRSMSSYNANPEITKKLLETENHQAINRVMSLFSIRNEKGKPMGSYNWFGLHPTSMSNQNKAIHFDSKGYAAVLLEEKMMRKQIDYIAASAQKIAGDVTSNFFYDANLKRTRGPHISEDANARHFGALQANHAHKMLQEGMNQRRLLPKLDFALSFVDFSCQNPHADFTGGLKNCETSAAVHGASFLVGTAEGPGTQNTLETMGVQASGWIITQFKKLNDGLLGKQASKDEWRRKQAAQAPKSFSIESGNGCFLGARVPSKIVIPDAFDPSIALFKKAGREGAFNNSPWVPHILPLQIAIFDTVALVGIGAEITTIAGLRLEKTVKEVLGKRGVQNVIIASHSNAYNGYITTAEEYELQNYEGGHTVFGKWTLAAYQTQCRLLAEQLLLPPEERTTLGEGKALVFAPETVWTGEEQKRAAER